MQAVLYIVENSMQTVSKVLEQKTVPFIASATVLEKWLHGPTSMLFGIQIKSTKSVGI